MGALAGTSVVVVGAGLAGLAAARTLSADNAAVTVVEARDRVGGRVWTLRNGFEAAQHAEAGADLIEEEQSNLLGFGARAPFRPVRILRRGFASAGRQHGTRIRDFEDGWEELQRALRDALHEYRLAEEQWTGPIARRLGSFSVAEWLARQGAGRKARDTAKRLRGFFLAEPGDLSLLALLDQVASDDSPAQGKFFRLRGGNDRLPAALASTLGNAIHLDTTAVLIRQDARRASVSVTDRTGTLVQIPADYLVVALPATTLKDIRFEPSLPEPQRRAIESLPYGTVTKALLQFTRPFWRRRDRPQAFGTDLDIGAVWDANEEQGGSRRPGILTLFGGASTSLSLQRLLARSNRQPLVSRLRWLGASKASELRAVQSVTWEAERWSRGGYAYFGAGYDPGLRQWLARPFGRVVFAGEHTSWKGQGYMEGAVVSGLRAAAEVRAFVHD